MPPNGPDYHHLHHHHHHLLHHHRFRLTSLTSVSLDSSFQEPPLYKDSSHVRLEGSRGVEIVDLRRRWRDFILAMKMSLKKSRSQVTRIYLIPARGDLRSVIILHVQCRFVCIWTLSPNLQLEIELLIATWRLLLSNEQRLEQQHSATCTRG